MALILIGIILIILPEKPRVPLVTEWKIINGEFFNNGEPAEGDLPLSIISSSSSKFWRSWAPSIISKPNGHIKSFPFLARVNTIELPVIGYPAAPGNEIYLENIATKQKLSLRYGNVHEIWQTYFITIPRDWKNMPLCVGAESSNSNYYVGVGTPFLAEGITLLKRSLPVCVAWHALICILLFLTVAPFNNLLQSMLGTKKTQTTFLFFPLAIVLLGYFLFFLYYIVPSFSKFFSVFLLIIGIICEWRNILEITCRPSFFFKNRPAFLAWVFISGFSWLVLNSQYTLSLEYISNYRFSPASWSTDNQLPIIIAKALSEGKSLHGLLGLWQVSDRPPALAGLLAPFHQLTSWMFSNPNSSQLGGWLAHLLGICVMATWIFPIWECLKEVGVRAKMRCYSIILLSISPFIFFNTIYTWPKLISATLAFTGWLFLNRLKIKSSSKKEAIAAGLSFGGALMCHGSIFFGLCAMGFLCLTRMLKTQWKNFLLVGLVFFLVIAPWLIFVSQIDPPGNALTKCTFAGTFGFTEKNKSLLHTIEDAYKNDTFEAWITRKSLLMKTFIGAYNPVLGAVGYIDEGLAIRRAQFYYLIPVLGLLLLPLCWGTYFYYSNKENRKPKNNFSADTFLRLGVIGILVQGLLTWDPFPVHHLAYSSVFCLHLAAVIYLCEFSKKMHNIFLGAAILLFGAFWIISPACEFGSVNILTFIASLGLLIVIYSFTVALALGKKIQ